MKNIIIGLILFAIFVAGAYYYFSGKEYVITLTEDQIQQKLEEKLPFNKTYLLIIQVTLDNPRVHLENGSDRVGAGLDVTFNINLKNNPKSLGGTVDATGNVFYFPEKGEFYLINPVIENLQVQGVPEKYLGKVNDALTKALSKYYNDHPIYKLKTSDTKQAVAKLVLKNVQVENGELVLTLSI